MNAIDCFHLSSDLLLPDLVPDGYTSEVCLKYNDSFGSYLSGKFNKAGNELPIYRLVTANDTQMKVIPISQLVDGQPFDGTINGSQITAVLNWTLSDGDWLYFFAGRHLCRQLISSEWTQLCREEDISDWVQCSMSSPNATTTSIDTNGNKTGNNTLITVLLIVFGLVIALIVISVIVFLLCQSSTEAKPKPEGKESEAAIAVSNTVRPLGRKSVEDISDKRSKDIIHPMTN